MSREPIIGTSTIRDKFLDPNKDYIARLLSDGVNTPVEKVTDSRDLHLPEWYDEVKFKR